MIGSLGRVIFSSSTNKVLTFSGLSKQAEARYHEHTIIAGKPKLEFLGAGLDEVSFNIKLDRSLGVSPSAEIKKLADMRDSGKAEALIIGGEFLALFVIASFSENWKTVDNRGRLLAADLTINLREYS
jgi:phage protein U